MLDLFWIGMGTEDGGYEKAKRLSQLLTDSAIKHTFLESPEGTAESSGGGS